MATPGNGVSGREGDVLLAAVPVSEIKKWTWNPKIEVKEYVSNKTNKAKKRIASNKDGSGSIDGVWDPWDPITDHLDVGTEVTLQLQHYTGQMWLVPAIIESLTFDVDIETGDVEGWSADYSTTGLWTKPVALAATTTTTTAALFAGFEEAGDLMEGVAPAQGAAARQGQEAPYTQPAHQGQASPGLSQQDFMDLTRAVATALHQMGWGPHGQTERANPDRPNQARVEPTVGPRKSVTQPQPRAETTA